MNKLISVNVHALTDLAASTAEKEALAKFGLPVIHDAEIQAIMEEELAANRKEATRAAVREIMAINSIADAELRAQFEAIRNANRVIAAARESAKNIALARAYGAETRDYIPLMMLLGAPISFDQRRSIPAEWLQANSEKVLAAFKEQGRQWLLLRRPLLAQLLRVQLVSDSVLGPIPCRPGSLGVLPLARRLYTTQYSFL